MAVFYLPAYLYEEAMSQDGKEIAENMNEYWPSVVFGEQLLRMFPREHACKMRLYPAFEETFMRWQEEYDQRGSVMR